MINTKELRIGNWLFGDNPLGSLGIPPPSYFQVENIFEDKVNVWQVEGFGDEWSNGEPIPLTPEILLKCGFNVKKNHIFTLDINGGEYIMIGKLLTDNTFRLFEFYHIDNQGEEVCYSLIPIMSLHQLQNLYFALTGEELTFQL